MVEMGLMARVWFKRLFWLALALAVVWAVAR